MTTPTLSTATVNSAPTIGEIRAAAEAFRAAHAAAEQVRFGLTRGQESGPDALPPGAEYLLEEAQYRYDRLLALTGLDGQVSAILARQMSDEEIDEVLGAAAEYSPRPTVTDAKPPTFDDWRDSIGRIDWSTGRGAA